MTSDEILELHTLLGKAVLHAESMSSGDEIGDHDDSFLYHFKRDAVDLMDCVTEFQSISEERGQLK